MPGLEVVGTRNGYQDMLQVSKLIEDVNASNADILLVGIGVPDQDVWLHKMCADLHPAVVIGVGGLFDYYSGRVMRAPRIFRGLGFEWLWRLFQEPRRLGRRYLIGNFVFVFRALYRAAMYRMKIMLVRISG